MANAFIDPDISMDNQDIYDFENLYNSMRKCAKGVSYKTEVGDFLLNGLERTYKLEESIKNGTYKPRKPRRFTLLYPKRRDVVATSFRDRVPQRSLNDNALYPALTKSLIHTNFACQKGKGTDMARKYFYNSLQSMATKYKNNFFIFKTDYKGYYKNLIHDRVNDRLKRKLNDEFIYNETQKVLEGQYEGSTGYNPGSQMVQIVGISYPDDIDHFSKEICHQKTYTRYMDDIVSCSNNKQELLDYWKKLEKKSFEEGLTLHPNKTKIYDMRKEHITFLGFTFFVTDTGKVIMKVCKKNVKHYKRKLRKLVKKAKDGEMTREKIDMCYTSWKAHAEKGRRYKLFKMMDEYYEQLWR